MVLDLSAVQALCFDIDGTLAHTDDHIVTRLADLLGALPLVSVRRAERLARQAVMAWAAAVNSAYAKLDELGLDRPLSALRGRLGAIRKRGADPGKTRNLQAPDEALHEMMAGVKETIVALARHFPMCALSTGGVPRIEQAPIRARNAPRRRAFRHNAATFHPTRPTPC